MSWSPTDAELDALARARVPALSAESVEQARTSVLARAAGLSQVSPRARTGWYLGAVAAAAALVLWLAVRSAAPVSVSIVASDSASFQRVAERDVHLFDGTLYVQACAASTRDATVDVADEDAHFVLSAEHGSLQFLAVTRGRVSLRLGGDAPRWLVAGERFVAATRTAMQSSDARVAEALAPPPSPAHAPAVAVTPPPVSTVAPLHAPRVAASARPTSPALAPPVATTAPAPSTLPVAAPTPTPSPKSPAAAPSPPAANPAESAQPGAAEFRAGIASLRANDPSAATRSFEAACNAARTTALGEDACFWAGAAARRAGEIAKARTALARFLADFPRSGRAGEASALLGWIFYDAGDLDAAARHFTAAARDPSREIRSSAERGLDAVRRRRAE